MDTAVLSSPSPDVSVSAPASTAREPSAAELAKLGMDTKPVESSPTVPQTGDGNTDSFIPNADGLQTDLVGEAVKRGRPARDFTGLPDEDKEIFQNMSRAGYEKLYPIYRKLQEGKIDVDQAVKAVNRVKELEAELAKPRVATYHDHPDAHYLDQAYRQTLVERSTAQDTVTFWEKQLAAAKAGQPIHALQKGPNGELQVVGPYEANPAAEAHIMRQLTESVQTLSTYQAKLSQIAESHKATYGNYTKGLDEFYKKHFGPHEESLKSLAQKHLDSIPEFAREKREAKIAAYALAALEALVRNQQQSATTQAATAATAKAAKSAGPSPTHIPAAVDPKKTTIDATDFGLFKAKFGVR